MIVTLIVLCEVGFWVLLAAGLGLRYLAKMPRTGAAVLLCEPLLEVVLLVVTVLDLRAGAAPTGSTAWRRSTSATPSPSATTPSAGSTATPATASAAARRPSSRPASALPVPATR